MGDITKLYSILERNLQAVRPLSLSV